jgi:hypothetical protein
MHPQRRSTRQRGFHGNQGATEMHATALQFSDRIENLTTGIGKGIVGMRGRLTIVVFLGLITAIPSFAQKTRWDVDSGHSTARLILSSSQKPGANINVGVARVSGTVVGTAGDSDPSVFNVTIFPAGTPDPRSEDGGRDSDFQNTPDYTVIAFKSKVVRPVDGTAIQVTGDLTVTYVERVATYGSSESYSGPVYGPPITHSQKREVTFQFQRIHRAGLSEESAGRVEWTASNVIQGANFPELLRAVETTNWPVLVEDEHCEMPLTTGEDYSGPKCTGTLAAVTPRADVRCEMPPTTGEGFSGEVCTGTPLLTYPTDTEHIRQANQSAAASGQLVANEVTIDLDLILTTPNMVSGYSEPEQQGSQIR